MSKKKELDSIRTKKKENPRVYPLNEGTSRSMRSNKAKNTKPELIVRKMLWAAGLRGYRLHRKDIPGRPDMAFIGKKIAIFVNGCFWHRCPHCKPGLPKHNRRFWLAKFKRNQERDRENLLKLRNTGWKVLTLWECRLRESPEYQTKKFKSLKTTSKGKCRIEAASVIS